MSVPDRRPTPSITDVVRALAGKYEKGDAWKATRARLDHQRGMERAVYRHLLQTGKLKTYPRSR